MNFEDGFEPTQHCSTCSARIIPGQVYCDCGIFIEYQEVDNAIKYGTRARATFDQDEERITILIDDDGPGFSEEARSLLLEPFVRAEPSRSRGTGGAGLGLSVARSLTEAHDGAISLENTPRGGRVKVTLPLFKSG